MMIFHVPLMHLSALKHFFIKNSRVLAALFFSAVGLYARYKELAGRELWGDEIYQLHNTTGPFQPVWQRLSLGELTCFPGEYLINYPFVNFLGSNKWLINIPHILATALGFFLLYLICQKHLKTFLGLVIAFLIFCFNGNLIFHAFEFRAYAVLPTLSLASFYLAEKIVSGGRQLSRLKKFLIGAFFVFAIIYHAYGIMIVGLCLLFFIVIEARQRSYPQVIKDVSPFLLGVGLFGIPVFFWFASGNVVNPANCQVWNINTFDAYPNPVHDPVHFLRQVFANLLGNKKYGEKLLGLGIWIAFLLPHKDRAKQIGFFLLLILFPILLILLSDLRGGYWFLDRQFIWVMPLYAFFLGWCWESILVYVSDKIRGFQFRRKSKD